MSFKKRMLTLLFTLSLGGCAQEDQNYFKTAVINLGDHELCLTEFTESIESFIFGDLSKQEVISFWNCIGQGVKLFRVYVKGKNPNQISKEELREFLQFFFIKVR